MLFLLFFCALLIWQLYMCKFSWADLGKTNQELKATDSNPKWAGPCQTCVKWKGLGKVWTSWNHTVVFPAFDFFCQDLNKVAMGIYRPCSGIFVRLSQRVVQENSQLMGSFTSQRPIRRSADLARPIWSAKTTCPSGSALLSLSTVRSFELYMFFVVALLHMSALFCSASLISRLFSISWDLGGKHEIYLGPENLFPLLAFLRLNFCLKHFRILWNTFVFLLHRFGWTCSGPGGTRDSSLKLLYLQNAASWRMLLVPSRVRPCREQQLQGHPDLRYIPLGYSSFEHQSAVQVTPAVGRGSEEVLHIHDVYGRLWSPCFGCELLVDLEHCLIVAARDSHPSGVLLIFLLLLVSSVFMFWGSFIWLFSLICLLFACLNSFLAAFLYICSGFVHVLPFCTFFCINHL